MVSFFITMDQDTVKKILDGVKKAYAEFAPEFDNTRKTLWPGFYGFRKYIKEGDAVLDAGCGNGRLSLLMENKKAQYIGMDNNSELLKIAKKNFPEKKFISGDILNMPFDDKSFDVVFCVATFHHLPDKNTRHTALQEMVRVLKPSGTLIMTNWLFLHKRKAKYFLKNIFLKLLGKSHLGFKDAMIPWGGGPLRYYHLFSKRELRKLFRSEKLKVEALDIAKYSREKNLVIIAKNNKRY